MMMTATATANQKANTVESNTVAVALNNVTSLERDPSLSWSSLMSFARLPRFALVVYLPTK